jgi:cellulose biosynthesis protein BcsQ
MIRIAFFNNKGGVGKTSLLYHLAWALTDFRLRVIAVDLDPQSNLSALCLEDERMEELWDAEGAERRTVFGAVFPVKEELGDVGVCDVEAVSPSFGLLPGDIHLASFEAKLSEAWPRCVDRHAPSFRATTSFHRLIGIAGRAWGADIALIDVGPNLGALNRAVLIAAEHIVVPLGADLFSIQGLRNLGPTLGVWRREWAERVSRNPITGLDLPSGSMEPAGYVVMQPNLYGGKVTRSYERWLARVPDEYARHVRGSTPEPTTVVSDPHCLAVLKHYRSLMPLAHEARKPIFHLQAADGALGSHAVAARDAGRDFRALANRLGAAVGLPIESG